MTNWTPPLATGLARGDRRVEDALRPHVDDLADSHQPGVYCLTLSTPTDRDYADVWLDHYEELHPEIDAMQAASKVLYVGASKDVFARITDHAAGEVRQAAVPSVFKPHDVYDVRFFNTTDEAFAHEGRIAMELKNKLPVYVSWN